MNDLEYALKTINDAYKITLSGKNDFFVCQLTNNNQGFERSLIDELKEVVQEMTFELPTNISVLPKGKKPSSKKLFDGLEEIYCNCPELKEIIKKM